jgi:hypothetical protein
METCKDCLFYRYLTPANNIGICRRYPPVLKKDPENWCGEWKSKQVNIERSIMKLETKKARKGKTA